MKRIILNYAIEICILIIGIVYTVLLVSFIMYLLSDDSYANILLHNFDKLNNTITYILLFVVIPLATIPLKLEIEDAPLMPDDYDN